MSSRSMENDAIFCGKRLLENVSLNLHVTFSISVFSSTKAHEWHRNVKTVWQFFLGNQLICFSKNRLNVQNWIKDSSLKMISSP